MDAEASRHGDNDLDGLTCHNLTAKEAQGAVGEVMGGLVPEVVRVEGGGSGVPGVAVGLDNECRVGVAAQTEHTGDLLEIALTSGSRRRDRQW